MPSVEFFDPAGRANVRSRLEALIGSATKSFRAAVCFFTEAGYCLLSRHLFRLNLPDSYFVASVDFPTNLKSMLKLHKKVPGHVFIHLGGTTPEEAKVGRSLMHSKILLADGDEISQLWVGSHNLTAMAMQGGNFEAGVALTAPARSQAVIDAARHLEACRASAEPFNPNDMGRYEEIQRRRRQASDWECERGPLVIHAETAQSPTQSVFIVHVHVGPTEFDGYFRTDRVVRLFLHPPGALRPGHLVDYRAATLWTGEITAVVRTHLHPRNRGASGHFSAANFDIDVPDLATPPTFVPAGQSKVKALTQVVIRVDGRGELGAEVFSLSQKSPIVNVYDSAAAVEMHDADHDMVRFFTPESVAGTTLLYRPIVGVKQELVVDGYEETLRTGLPGRFESNRMPDADRQVRYSTRSPKYPIGSFFFLSNYVIRPRRTD